jgi:uncharacterized membrane protein
VAPTWFAGPVAESTTRQHRFASSRGLDRVVFFTDAISAIAITLLILPIIDEVSGSSDGGGTAGDFIGENLAQLGSFVISFAVIARLWYAHHQLFEHVERYSGPLAILSMGWAFTIVVLPLPTAMTSEFPPSPLGVGVYVGTMLVSSLFLLAMTLVIRGDKTLESQDNPVSARTIAGIGATAALFTVAFVVGVLIPGIHYWALLVLVISGPSSALILRLMGRRARVR